ncbi:MAG: hypothetical protein JW828_15480 [Sedimentisphaerales bacterium]|nr:hypothetical protein [Sedimentisphaerales bacterium]
MIRKIQIKAGRIAAEAELGNTPTARAIFDALPLRAAGDRWGGEIYFEIPVSCELEADSRETLLPGELGYWPEGKCFCIFLGPTPASEGQEIRPASAVNVFGRLVGDWDALQSVEAGVEIRIKGIKQKYSKEPPKVITPQEVAQAGQEATQEEGIQEDQEERLIEETTEASDAGEIEQEAQEQQLGIAAADIFEAPIVKEPEAIDKEHIELQKDKDEEKHESTEKSMDASENEMMQEPSQEPSMSDSTDDLYTPINEPEEIPLQKPVDLDEQNLSMGMTPETSEPAPEPPPAIASTVKIEMTRQTMILLVVAGLVIAALAFILGIMSSGGTGSSLSGKLDVLSARIETNEGDLSNLKTATSDLDKTVKGQAATISDLQKTGRAQQQTMSSLDTQVTQIKKEAVRIAALATRQDITWVRNPANGHQYTLTPYPLPWHLARDYATKVGGHLVTINDEAENEWLVKQFGEGVEYWIGLTDELEEGKWIWVTGESIDYLNWAPGEPDNFLKKQHYVMLNDTKPHRNQVEPGKWNDITSNEVRIGIIEKEK